MLDSARVRSQAGCVSDGGVGYDCNQMDPTAAQKLLRNGSTVHGKVGETDASCGAAKERENTEGRTTMTSFSIFMANSHKHNGDEES